MQPLTRPTCDSSNYCLLCIVGMCGNPSTWGWYPETWCFAQAPVDTSWNTNIKPRLVEVLYVAAAVCHVFPMAYFLGMSVLVEPICGWYPSSLMDPSRLSSPSVCPINLKAPFGPQEVVIRHTCQPGSIRIYLMSVFRRRLHVLER